MGKGKARGGANRLRLVDGVWKMLRFAWWILRSLAADCWTAWKRGVKELNDSPSSGREAFRRPVGFISGED